MYTRTVLELYFISGMSVDFNAPTALAEVYHLFIHLKPSRMRSHNPLLAKTNLPSPCVSIRDPTFSINIAYLMPCYCIIIPTLFIQYNVRERYQRLSLYEGIRPVVIDLESQGGKPEYPEKNPRSQIEARGEPGSQRWEARLITAKPP